LSQTTEIRELPDGEERISLRLLVLTHYQRVTDRPTDTLLMRSTYNYANAVGHKSQQGSIFQSLYYCVTNIN